LDISVDGATAEILDAARGISGSLSRIERGLDLLVAERTNRTKISY
jgi:MoaA/NifB/PqqE/SkfB family radical SAM enzyme